VAGTGANDEEAFFSQVDEKERGGERGTAMGTKVGLMDDVCFPVERGWGKYVTRPTEGLHTAP
jgi:hypothetical protein